MPGPSTPPSDRPTALDIALDAIDEAFRQALIQFTKNEALSAGNGRNGLLDVERARVRMIQHVNELFGK